MIIATGVNSNKTHPNQLFYDKYRDIDKCPIYLPKIHAEMACLTSIRKFNINPQKIKLYIYREKHDGSFGMARPCKACMAAIKDAGIKCIYYTTDSGYAMEELNGKT